MSAKRTDLKDPWLEKGYEIFSVEGPKGLKIERLAREVKKSKSSFYHFFADLEIFTNQLLDLHTQNAKVVLEKELKCEHLIPDLLHVIVAHNQDFLFNRQLRINSGVNCNTNKLRDK